MKNEEKAQELAKRCLDNAQPWLRQRIVDGLDNLNVVECAHIVSMYLFGETDNGDVSPTGYHFNRFGFVSLEEGDRIIAKVMSKLKGE